MAFKDCIAMILAGGQGSRLGVLTKQIAKPAVPFGAKYRMIDFALSNCAHSGIDTVGVLTQYQPLELNTYIGNGKSWDLDRNDGGVYILPPFVKSEHSQWYQGTANAIYQNISFVDQYNAKNVLVLSGDHIYKMNYAKLLEQHIRSGAAATVAVTPVPMGEAHRFGIMTTDSEGTITHFCEKPARPTSNLASMGVYIFRWELLKKYLMMDENNPKSDHDFGKNVIPSMLAAGERLFAYSYQGYWRDVGTLCSFWQANMDLLCQKPELNLYDDWKVYSKTPTLPPHYVDGEARVENSLIAEGSAIYGTVRHSVVFGGVTVEPGAVVEHSILMPNVTVGANAQVWKSVVGDDSVISALAQVGAEDGTLRRENHICTDGITLIGRGVYIDKGVQIARGDMVDRDVTGEDADIVRAPQQDEEQMIS